MHYSKKSKPARIRKLHYDNRSYKAKALKTKTTNSGRNSTIVYYVIFAFCFVYFVVQVIQFSTLYYQYPISVDVEVIFTHQFELPAISFCYNQALVKSVVCNSSLTRSHCSRLTNETNIREIIARLNIEQLLKFTIHQDDYIYGHNVSGFTNSSFHNSERGTWSLLDDYICYTLYERWENKEKVMVENTSSRITFKFKLNMSEDEMVCQLPPRKSMLYIHSSDSLPYNADSWIELFPGKKYDVSVKPSRILLLESPYSTACKNYSKGYTQHGEYLSQKNCIIRCKQRVLDSRCGCIPAVFVPVTQKFQKCVGIYNKFDFCYDNAKVYLSNCNAMECPIGCEVEDYDSTATSVFLTEISKQFKCYDYCGNVTLVNIYIETYKLLLYNHKPKFQAIEILGYVGGNLGIWLGLSIPSIYKNLESCAFVLLFKMKNYFISKKTIMRNKPILYRDSFY